MKVALIILDNSKKLIESIHALIVKITSTLIKNICRQLKSSRQYSAPFGCFHLFRFAIYFHSSLDICKNHIVFRIFTWKTHGKNVLVF